MTLGDFEVQKAFDLGANSVKIFLVKMVNYMIYSDGFLHVLMVKELFEELSPQKIAVLFIIVNIIIWRVITK